MGGGQRPIPHLMNSRSLILYELMWGEIGSCCFLLGGKGKRVFAALLCLSSSPRETINTHDLFALRWLPTVFSFWDCIFCFVDGLLGTVRECERLYIPKGCTCDMQVVGSDVAFFMQYSLRYDGSVHESLF